MSKLHTTTNELPIVLRPREKLMRYGPEKLSTAELLAIILRTGKKGQNSIVFSEKLITYFGYDNLEKVHYQELATYNGLGPAKACEIVAAFELGRRIFLKEKKAVTYNSPKEVWQELKEFAEKRKEHVIVICLNGRDQEIRRDIISVGTLSASLVHPREVFEPAVSASASHVIIVHNHPSGDPLPSSEDDVLTNRLVQAGIILGIPVADHLIITTEEYFSYKQEGKLS